MLKELYVVEDYYRKSNYDKKILDIIEININNINNILNIQYDKNIDIMTYNKDNKILSNIKDPILSIDTIIKFGKYKDKKLEELYNMARVPRVYKKGVRIQNPYYHYYAVYQKI